MPWPFKSRKRAEEDDKKVPQAGTAGFGREYGMHFTRHAQPDPGMAAVSYDVMALPLYTPIGPSVQNRRQFLVAPSNPVVYQNQAISLTTVGNPGNLAGTFRSSPLLDVTSNSGELNIPGVFAPGEFELAGRRAS